MIAEANINDPEEVALMLLRMMEVGDESMADSMATNAAKSALEVLRMCQLHGTSFAHIGRFMDVIPLEAAYNAPTVEVPQR